VKSIYVSRHLPYIERGLIEAVSKVNHGKFDLVIC